jgi:heat shock protein
MKSLLLLFCLALFGVSCNSSKNMAKLDGVKWELKSLNDREVKLTDNNSEVYLQFNEAEKKVSGRGGCNRFFGNYEMDGDKLKFSPLGATRMACPDLQLETEFFKALETVDTYSIKDGLLSLKSKDKVVAVFNKAEEPKK